MSAAGNKSSIGDRYGGAHDEIGVGRVTNGTRILPPSVAHGTSASPSHFNGLSDPMHRNGIAEERNSENDERLIYQAALQVFILISTFDFPIPILVFLLCFYSMSMHLSLSPAVGLLDFIIIYKVL